MNPPSARVNVWVCSLVLALPFAGKVAALIHGGGLLAQAHHFLPGTFELYVWLSLATELVTFLVLAVFGGRAFLTVCLGLATLFIGYHALEVGLRVTSPCPCLGGLLGHWRALAEVESALSFLLACGLGVSSFVGLFPVSRTSQPDLAPQPANWTAGLTSGLWLAVGATVVWLWEGRILGGDEGMEAAKSFQLLAGPDAVARMWNDQPPLWSYIGAGIFGLFGPSAAAGRLTVVLFGVLLPLTWAVYWSREGMKWAAVFTVGLLWLAIPSYFASFMLEAPAYAVGTASLLPLILRGHGRLPLFASAFVAALALSIKLTAAFALVVPFTWLLQRGWRAAGAWGGTVAALVFLGSLLQPGWAWESMGASHLSFASKDIGHYRLDPTIYAQGWLVCALALFALANRYVKNRLEAIIPWLSAAMVALVVHLLHRPFWDYYNLHLMTPLVVLAGVGAVDLWQTLREARITRWERGVAWALTVILGLFWAQWQVEQVGRSHGRATKIDDSPITKELRALGKSGHSMFALEPFWTFAAGHVQTPPELTVIPLKRAWSGQINDTVIAAMLASNRVDALVLNQYVLKQPVWTNLLADYAPTARAGRSILFVRRALNSKSIDLGLTSETVVDLRQLGL